MPKTKFRKKDAPKGSPPNDVTDIKFLAVIHEIRSLVSPLTHLEKLLPRTSDRIPEYPWPRIRAALEEGRSLWQANREAITGKLEEAFRIAEELCAQQLSRLEYRFRQEAENHGWSLQGSWPEPIVDQVVFVKIAPEGGKVIINDRTMPWCAIDHLVSEIDKERSELRTRNFSPEDWLAELCRAYDKVVGVLPRYHGRLS